jgi:hypothetical protein
MRRINVDLSELQAFARLAELRSFRAAAEKLGLSGSALSGSSGKSVSFSRFATYLEIMPTRGGARP